jgi:hypothetical protein
MNILKNIVLFLCSLIIALCVAEYAVRKINIEGLSGRKMYMDSGNCYPSDPAGRLPLKMNNPADGKYWYCVTYDKKLRLQGFNPERKRQIAIVGDSFAFGNGVTETDTLGYLLNESYPEINFQNWGKSGANIDDVVKESKEIIKYVPKLEEVIYFYNLNDIRMSKEVTSQLESIIDFQNIRWWKDKEPSDPVSNALSKSALFSLIRKVLVLEQESSLTVLNYKNMYLGESNRQEFLSTMDEMKSIKDMLAQHGISFRLVIHPLLYKDLLGRYPFESIHAQIINACNERKIMCLDGYAPFKNYYSLKKFAVHPLDYHPNGLSNRELVNYIRKKDFVTDRANVSKR